MTRAPHPLPVALLALVFLVGMIVVGGLGDVAPARADDDDAAKPSDEQLEEIERLLKALDADDPTAREDATDALIALGKVALSAVRAHVGEAPSAEARMRAEQIVRELERWGGGAPTEFAIQELFAAVREANAAAELVGPSSESVLRALAQVKALAAIAAVAAGKEPGPLPVDPATLTPAAPTTSMNAALVVAPRVEGTVARGCVIFADEFVRLSNAQDCIIVSRVGVRLSSSKNCVIVAGAFLGQSRSEASLLVSGGGASLTSGTDVVVAAAEGFTFTRVEGGTTINTPPGDARFARRAQELDAVEEPRLDLEGLWADNPLAGKIEVTDVLRSVASRGFLGTASNLVLLRTTDGRGEFVAREGAPVLMPDGKPLPELEGWTLRMAESDRGGRYVLFSDGEREALFRD